MSYLSLLNLRSAKKEVERLENLGKQMAVCRDLEKRKAYFDYLEQCKQDLQDLLSKDILKQSLLSNGEMEMAKNYYYKGMTWRDAFENSPLFKESYNVDDDKKINKDINTHKKNIERSVQIYYKF